MKYLLTTVAALGAFALAAQARAGSTNISLLDIDNNSNYQDTNLSDTFAGTGYVGIYPGGNTQASFGQLFGMENYSGVFSETEMEADISALAGDTISSATLSFVLNDGTGGSATYSLTSFTANGTLSYHTSAPNNLGTITGNFGSGSNTIDVTSLVQAAVSGNDPWLGLYLTPTSDSSNWTYSTPGSEDDAQVRLNIEFSPAAPDSASTLFLLALGTGALLIGARGLKRGQSAA